MNQKRTFIKEKDGMVYFRVRGILTFAPLSMSKEEWIKLGEVIPKSI